MIRTTTWSPDTCSCVVEYEWDDTTTEDERVHSYKNIKKACAAHAPTLDGQKIHDDVKEENQRKNRVVNEIARLHPSLGTPNKDDEGNILDYSPNPKFITWSFDADRRLKVEIKGNKINNQQKISLSANLRTLAMQGVDTKGIKVDKVDIL